ncbi:MAG: PorP/SprF family type IX secretion system membrane protein [Bacteroidales bacterium]|jgi:type IX secretion system PorP/SprF family membrane protein|nr:PorP/SprF family type IX secretion system membrane protein [Bacteroidales bacterium]
MKFVQVYISLIIVSLSFQAWGQQDPLFSQQHLTRLNINPATTGNTAYANAYLFARQQWIGFEGAPSTQMLAAQAYFKDYKSGVGLSVLNDRIGRHNLLDVLLNYAYHVPVGDEKYVALGLGAGIANRKMQSVSFIDPEEDPFVVDANNAKAKTRLDLNVGLAYISPKFTMGFSATHLNSIFMGADDWYKLPLHIYGFMEGTFGKDIQVSPRAQIRSEFQFKSHPSDTLALMDRVSMQYDLGASVSIKDVMWFGFAFRNVNTFVGMFGINLGQNLRLSYAYDFTLSFYNRQDKYFKTYGSHELVLHYKMRIAEMEDAEQEPRFFD